VNPSTRVGAILDEREGLRQELVEILEHFCCQDLVLKLAATHYFMARNQAQISHSDLLRLRLFNQRHPRYSLLVFIFRELFLHFLQEEMIDHVDQLHMPGQQFLKHLNRPLLHLALLDVVEAASEGVVGDRPRLVPGHVVLVYEEAEHF
jgi:hypothetical protein